LEKYIKFKLIQHLMKRVYHIKCEEPIDPRIFPKPEKMTPQEKEHWNALWKLLLE